MSYSPELATAYAQRRNEYSKTDHEVLDALSKYGVINKTILDLGCGDGRHAVAIKNMGASRVIGIDDSVDMIRMANERKRAAQATDIEFTQADGQNIPLPDQSCDIVFSNFVFHYFEDSAKLFKEISRVLKPGGIIVATFNITHIAPEAKHLLNTNMPIRLGGKDSAIVVQNLIKSNREIVRALHINGFIIKERRKLNHVTAYVDDSFKHKDKIEKIAIICIAQKLPKQE